ncbi:MAG: hypothetical protein BM564_10160 [Bacteroidetes bacterium MedPE-SWsnd-G2]|nr:MAG: hypothetical protein BM564_10160 [Bacteroidetes bacterium MedPE-SWsnd-G2]
MQFFSKVLNFFINSSIHVALAAFALGWVTLIEFDVPFSESVLYFIFFGTITAYNFVKYFGLAKFHHRSLTNSLKQIQIFSFFAFLFMCYYAAQLELKTIVYVGVLGLVTILYAIPFFPRKHFLDGNKNLRSISGMKIYIIGIVWAGITVFIPLLNAGVSFGHDPIITFAQRFLIVMVLVLPFDIRDMTYDHLKLGTLPQSIGLKRTKLIAYFTCIFIGLLQSFKFYSSDSFAISLYVTLLVIVVSVYFSNTNQGKYYASFWVEAIPIGWLALLLLF